MEIPGGYDQQTEYVTRKGLPSSAKEFVLWHREHQWEKAIPPFVTMLNKKIVAVPGNNQQLFEEASVLYIDVGRRDIPLYERSINNLQRLSKTSGPNKVVMYGRDTDYLAMAVLANELGGPKVIGKPILLSISRDMGWGLSDHPDRLELVRRLFEQRGVDSSFIHVDVGKYGNVPRSIIRALWPSMTEDEVNSHVKLIDPQHLRHAVFNLRHSWGRDVKEGEKIVRAMEKDPAYRPIESLGEVAELEELMWDMGYATIESRPHFTQQAKEFVEDQESDKVYILKEQSGPREQLLAWVVGQAVVRHFLPKRKPKHWWKFDQ